MWTPRGIKYSRCSVVAHDEHLPRSLGHIAELHAAVDLRDDRRLPRLAGLEQLDDARQTTGDVLRFGGGARDLGQDVAGVDLLAVPDHQVGVSRHEVALLFRS